MNRIQIACYALLGSAILLAALVLAAATGGVTPTAHAGQIVAAGGGAVLTARTDSDAETVFVLDDTADRIVILQTDTERGRIEVLQQLEVRSLFDAR